MSLFEKDYDPTEMSSLMMSRKIGNLPLSIATSNALEIALGMGTAPEENPATENLLKKYDAIWFNLRTLARNAYGSLATEDKQHVTGKDIFTVLYKETHQILDIIDHHIPGCREVRFYTTNYSGIERKVEGLCEIRKPRTEKQIAQASVINEGIAAYKKLVDGKHKKSGGDDDFGTDGEGLHEFTSPISAKSPIFDTAVMTHHPIDLLRWEKFKSLTLFESHTGALKTRDQWCTKFADKTANPMPFNAASLMIFGDHEMFKPLNEKTRAEVIAIAKARGWNGYTTPDRFLLGLELSKNKYLLDIARRMMRAL